MSFIVNTIIFILMIFIIISISFNRKTYGMDGTVSGTAGGFSAMTQDALTVLNDIPFSIPPYFALLARAIVTLEGVALTGDPSYGIILESYPFVARKLLSEDRPEIQRALQQVLYAKGGDGLQTTRLSVLLNSALGVVARQSGGAFVDFDSIPEGAVDLTTSVKFLLSEKAVSLREVLIDEAVNAGDILLRQAARKAFSQITTRLPTPPFFGRFLPRPENIRAPFLIPSASGGAPFTPVFLTPVEMLDCAAPKLTRDEEFFAISLSDAASQTLGKDAGVVVKGDSLLDPAAALRVVLGITSSKSVGEISNPLVTDISKRILSALSANRGIVSAANSIPVPAKAISVASSSSSSSSSISSPVAHMDMMAVTPSSTSFPSSSSTPLLITESNESSHIENDSRSSPNHIPALSPDKSKVYNADDGLSSVADGLSDLTTQEKEALRTTATIVFERLRDRIVTRLQPLVKV